MYPPVTTSSSAIKSQTYRQKGKVFYNNNPDYNRRDFGGASGKSRNENLNYGRDSQQRQHVYRAGSTGSHDSSSGTPTSPSISTPLSRTSSAGSSSQELERPGSAVARQGAVIAQKESYAHPRGQPMLQSSHVFFPSSSFKKPLTAAQPTPASPRNTRVSGRPFNHKEVLDHMEKAFKEAKKAIQAGRGRIYDPSEHGKPIEFTPFDWEDFWASRKKM
ncbi:hypothetical protein RvY_13317-2 [Ramazzottius varieornatus]|uniref:Uncharacterized protein n=1 Tax=Ramazzottius varieornatus TaxID=947166 RepID=A0A1D1VUY5_RAMVA|nr:hypothetical protein RvY_13317-2 [Ramazzottius varieornatus]